MPQDCPQFFRHSKDFLILVLAIEEVKGVRKVTSKEHAGHFTSCTHSARPKLPSSER